MRGTVGRGAAAAGVVALLAAGLLAGCTHRAPAPEPTEVVVTSTATPGPSATPSASAPAAGGSEPVDPRTGAGGPDPGNAGTVGDFLVVRLVEIGPLDGARGTVTKDSRGTPVAYTVAAGDDLDHISERFQVLPAYLVTINSKRRCGATELYAGDVLNLDAHTIGTVGSIHGGTKDCGFPDPRPAQH